MQKFLKRHEKNDVQNNLIFLIYKIYYIQSIKK